MSRTIDTAEVAKYVRAALKRAFPTLPARFFSVRIDRYSMGSSVDVSWTDGPTEATVRAVTDAFCGGRFEGMTDCAYSADSWYCPEHGARTASTYGCDLASNNDVHAPRCCARAELVHFANTSFGTRRHLSPEFTAELRAAVRAESGLPAEGADDDWLPQGSQYARGQYDDVRTGVYRLSVHTSKL